MPVNLTPRAFELKLDELFNNKLKHKQFFRRVYCLFVARGDICSCLATPPPPPPPPHDTPHLRSRSPSSNTKGLAEITVLRCIKSDLPRGRFDWLKTWHRGICGYFPCRGMEAHSNAPAGQVHNTYLYLQSVEHLYLYTFHLCVASYLLTPGCVSHLCGQICLLCIFYFSHIHFLLLTLCRNASGD